MIIEIDQTLHGYKNGHQLLASSRDLTPEERRLLLVHSDLSGSNAYGGFDSYITGFPIVESNFYCFSRTWYASEMSRPGCVWTHSLLIKFQDLGKIPEIESLLSLFKRPVSEKYRDFNVALEFELDYGVGYNSKINLDNAFVDYLYRNSDRGVVISADPEEISHYESYIISIWSNQWPRLRRNFYFCSWALSLRSLGSKLFDLQIIPARNRSHIERQSKEIVIADTDTKTGYFWKELNRFKKSEIRKFLWTFGSDIQGDRANYIPLLQVFYLTHGQEVDLQKLGNLIRSSFPDKDQARLMKTSIFGHNSIISQRVKEQELINYLVSEHDIDYLPFKDLDIGGRFAELVTSRKIDTKKLLSIWNHSISGRLPKEALQELYVDLPDLIQLLETNIDFLRVLDLNLKKTCTESVLWRRSSFELQKTILTLLSESKAKIDWRLCTYAILDANSKIILELRKLIGREAVYYSLDWLILPNNKWSFLDDWSKTIIIGDEYYFKDWLRTNRSKANSKVFKLIFSFYDPLRLHNLDIPAIAWAKVYSNLRSTEPESKVVYISCALLSLGLNNKVSGGQTLVVDTFPDVYRFAASSKIDYTIWKWIPNEEYEEEDDDSIFDVFSFFGFDSKKPKGSVPQWDYCEMLVRTLSNKFIKHSWSTQSFSEALQEKEVFIRAIDYCLSFKKGKKLISKLVRDSESGKIKLRPFQKAILMKV